MTDLIDLMIRLTCDAPLTAMRQMEAIIARSTRGISETEKRGKYCEKQNHKSTNAPSEGELHRQEHFNSAGPDEQTIVCYTQGNATLRHGIDGRRCFLVRGDLVDGNGSSNGLFEGVWGADVFTPKDLVNYPMAPFAPFDSPPKPGEQLWMPQLNNTKCRWNFGRRIGWIEAVGPALSRIHIHGTTHTQFWYSVAAFITGGGGVFAKVRGQATSMGSAYFVAVPEPVEATDFKISAVHVIKFVRPK